MLYLITIVMGAFGGLLGLTAALAATAGLAAGSGASHIVPWTGPAGALLGFVAATVITLFVKGGFRSAREIAIRSLAIVVAIGVVAAAGINLRSAAFAHLGISAAPRSVEFEIRLPPATAERNLQREVQVELHTDRNQTLASLDEQLLPMADGRIVLKGKVPLRYLTTNRFVVLNLPGDAQRLFKLRLPAQPSKSTQFGPWHLVDRIEAAAGQTALPNDIYAIRYRVL